MNHRLYEIMISDEIANDLREMDTLGTDFDELARYSKLRAKVKEELVGKAIAAVRDCEGELVEAPQP